MAVQFRRATSPVLSAKEVTVTLGAAYPALIVHLVHSLTWHGEEPACINRSVQNLAGLPTTLKSKVLFYCNSKDFSFLSDFL